MKKLSTREITLVGLFSAIIILQTYTPLGYFRLGAVDITLIHITVILAACLLGTKLGALIGGVWGITSLILAFQSAGPLVPLFHNPLISVVPRILVGVIAAVTFKWLGTKLTSPLGEIIAAIIGTLTNTVLVLSGFFLFGYQLIFQVLGSPTTSSIDPVLTFIFSLVTFNTLFEVIAAAIIVPAVLIPLRQLKIQR